MIDPLSPYWLRLVELLPPDRIPVHAAGWDIGRLSVEEQRALAEACAAACDRHHGRRHSAARHRFETIRKPT